MHFLKETFTKESLSLFYDLNFVFDIGLAKFIVATLHRKKVTENFVGFEASWDLIQQMDVGELALPQESKLPPLNSDTLLSISKRFVSILYFAAYVQIIYRITDHLQQPDFLDCKSIKDV